MTSTETPWGALEEEDGDFFLNGYLVLEVEPEGGFYVVTFEKGSYVARWVDEDGETHEKAYATARSALHRAREAWGR